MEVFSTIIEQYCQDDTEEAGALWMRTLAVRGCINPNDLFEVFGRMEVPRNQLLFEQYTGTGVGDGGAIIRVMESWQELAQAAGVSEDLRNQVDNYVTQLLQ
jgi:hypothetical protein